MRFLGVVATNGRAGDIPSTQAAFDALYAKERGVQRAVARTAKPMDDAQRTRIENIITKAVGGDASLKAKLERLNTAMKGA